jgi:hypothetical protein
MSRFIFLLVDLSKVSERKKSDLVAKITTKSLLHFNSKIILHHNVQTIRLKTLIAMTKLQLLRPCLQTRFCSCLLETLQCVEIG